MQFIDFLVTPLEYILQYAYQLTNSYGYAIMLFALIARVFLFPINILAHNNAIRFLRFYPSLQIIKQRYVGDKEQLNEKQYELFKKEKYNPLFGIFPLFFQLLLMIGMLQVMYRLPDKVAVADLYFVGLNLGDVPSLANPSGALLIPFLAGLAALVYCLVQNAISPAAMTQSRRTNNWMTIFTVALSLYLAIIMPTGVGLYWAASNIFGIIAIVLLNKIYDPRKLAGEAVAYVKSMQKSPEEQREERKQRKILRDREKRDAARFCAAKKRLVFYALSGGQYKYYKTIIDYILENSDIVIHYLTNDPNDAVLSQSTDRLVAYYASSKKTISLMLRLNTDILATTVPGLQSYQMKRSVVREDIEYIWIPHELASMHLIFKEDAFDSFDTIFCVGANRIAEVRRREEIAGLPRKTLVKVGASVYDQLVKSYEKMDKTENDRPRILIAPSWQVDNILELCIDDVLDALLGNGYEIIVRPHPQFLRMFPENIEKLKEKYSGCVADGELKFGLDFSDNEQIYTSDVVITDWSNTAFEFSYVTLKPSIFINTPMKVLNPNYGKYGLEALDITLRDRVGMSVNIDDMENLNDIVAQVLNNTQAFKEQIARVKNEYLYHPGKSGEAGGMYIIKQLEKRDKHA